MSAIHASNLYGFEDYSGSALFDKVASYPTHYASIDALAYRIKNDFDKDKDKAEAAYTWIALNIKYDIEGYYSLRKLKRIFYRTPQELRRKQTEQEARLARKTLIKKVGLCEGYAALYKILCKKLGLVSAIIPGYTRTNRQQIGRSLGIKNHAWNVVFYEGAWHLLDVTWGAGTETTHGTRWEFDFNARFFDAPAATFILTHLPADENWQLLVAPISEQSFFSKPVFYDAYFQSGIQLHQGHAGSLKVDAQTQKTQIYFDYLPQRTKLSYLTEGLENLKKLKIRRNPDGSAVGIVKLKHDSDSFLTVFLDVNAIIDFRINNIPK